MLAQFVEPDRRFRIAVVGAGIAGLSAAWLLSQRHEVTLVEAADRLGGHANTVAVGDVAVDTGFIVYTEATYPNFTALMRHLGVATRASDMSFAVSLDDGRLEYAGTDLGGLFAQPRNIVSPRFWSMLRDIRRFYRDAPGDAATLGATSLDDYLRAGRYGDPFRDDHLYPMAAAIWSTPAAAVGRYPAASFIRFCDNHGLLKLSARPAWRTVTGGSRTYVDRLRHAFGGRILRDAAVRRVRRDGEGVELIGDGGPIGRFDHVVIATHADQALAMLDDPSPEERRLLGAFAYSRNVAVLHGDPALMPARRRVWASWNYLAQTAASGTSLSVTYWMNRLQGLPGSMPLFVTLNPWLPPRAGTLLRTETYEHPLFDAAALSAQRQLWTLQGRRGSWFCGAYFGAGFHEDGLQAGLAVAERLGGVRRPWQVAGESGRIALAADDAVALFEAAQ